MTKYALLALSFLGSAMAVATSPTETDEAEANRYQPLTCNDVKELGEETDQKIRTGLAACGTAVLEDFDGNGTFDTIYMAKNLSDDSVAVLAQMGSNEKDPTVLKTWENIAAASRYGLSLRTPGTYQLACVEELEADCIADEQITLEKPSVDLLNFEADTITWAWHGDTLKAFKFSALPKS